MARIGSLAFFLAAAAALLLASCDSRPAREGAVNPLDPENASTEGDPYGLAASYAGGSVSLQWVRVAVPDLAGFTVFRKSDSDEGFVRVDTAGAAETRWTDPSPVRFATSLYRIAAIAVDGSEADTTGRGTVTVDVPPLFRIAGGAATTAARGVNLSIHAAGADRMILSEDSLFAGAAWEPFDTSKAWTLPEGKGRKILYLRVARDEADTSDVLADSISTAPTDGRLVLARGDSVTARARVGVRLSGRLLSSVIVGTDALFGDEADTTIAFDSLSNADSLDFDWIFDTGPLEKKLYARFSNEFGPDTIAVDSIRPDLLTDVSVRLAAGADVASVCEVSLVVDANATLMNLSSTLEFPPESWVSYDRETTWAIGDTAGVYRVWVQLSNDFVNLMESPASDTVRFLPIPLALVIESPADSSYAEEGDTVAIAGGVVAASCREAPDSVEVRIGDSLFVATAGDTSWSLDWVVDENPADTVEVRVIATVSDETDSTASDTIRVFVVPAE
jgi:hypothetical protein